MDDVDKTTEEAPEPSVLSENEETKVRVYTHKINRECGVEFNEVALETLFQEEQISPQRITNLQRHLTTLVTNIQTAADTRKSMRRKELEEARKIRLEWLENDVKSSQEKFEEIIRGWSMAKERVMPQELREALNSQQKLCAPVLKDKKKRIKDLQQELKVGDDRFVKDLREQAEELDLMMERMEDQIKTLTKAYREELTQAERAYQQESKVALTRYKNEWEQHMKDLREKELERLGQRKNKVVECEMKIHSMMLENMEKQIMVKIEQNAKLQILEREHQNLQATNMINKLKLIKQKHDTEAHDFNQSHINSRIISLQAEKKILVTKYTSQVKQLNKIDQYLSSSYKRSILKYERIHKKVKHFAVSDARKFEEMWLTIEAEIRQQVEGALEMDMLICKQHLGIAGEQPRMSFTGLSCPIQSDRPAHRPAHQDIYQPFQTAKASCCSQGMTDNSVASDESTGMDICKDGTEMQGDKDAKEENLSMETLKKIMELLCKETGFLIEDNLKLLGPQEKEQHTAMKLGSLLCSFGIEEQDFPKLANFFLKYKHQQSEQTEDVSSVSGGSSDQAEAMETSYASNLTSDFIQPNNVLPALKSFLKQYMPLRDSSCHQQPRVLLVQERTAHWEGMGNIISEDKVKLWEAAENTLKQYLVVLTEISGVVSETECLRQQNTELKMLLEQTQQSTTSW